MTTLPCAADDCDMESEYDCERCGDPFCGFHTVHPGPDYCDGCWSVVRQRGALR